MSTNYGRLDVLQPYRPLRLLKRLLFLNTWHTKYFFVLNDDDASVKTRPGWFYGRLVGITEEYQTKTMSCLKFSTKRKSETGQMLLTEVAIYLPCTQNSDCQSLRQLSNSMQLNLLEGPKVTQPLKQFPVSYGTQSSLSCSQDV
jgi:hypothetical protein